MMQKSTLGIIGGNGWLGSALGCSALSGGVIAPDQLVVTASRSGYQYAQWPGVTCVDTIEALIERADVVVLSVRPEQFATLETRLAGKLVISLMAGISIDSLKQATGSDLIVRAMPNAAAAIGRSWTPWCATPEVCDDARTLVRALLSVCGGVSEFDDEAHIDYLTGLTGSGPAFPALLADVLIQHAVTQGIPEHVARTGVLQSLEGSLALMLDGDAAPGEIVQRFLDYGGVTTEGLNAMIESGFREAVADGVDAAYDAAQPEPAFAPPVGERTF